jgi:hypothetical protein
MRDGRIFGSWGLDLGSWIESVEICVNPWLGFKILF